MLQLKDKALEMLQEEVMHLQVPKRREVDAGDQGQGRVSCCIMLETELRMLDAGLKVDSSKCVNAKKNWCK